MIGRRTWLRTATLAFVSLFSGGVRAQQGASFNSAEQIGQRNITPLRDQLTKGLRAITPPQRDFVEVVVFYVDQGKLPRGLVNLVYKWALERSPTVPFPYFQYALRILAQRQGVNLPLALPS